MRLANNKYSPTSLWQLTKILYQTGKLPVNVCSRWCYLLRILQTQLLFAGPSGE